MEKEEEPRITQIARITQIRKKKEEEEEETAENERTTNLLEYPSSALSELSVLSAVLLRIWPFTGFPKMKECFSRMNPKDSRGTAENAGVSALPRFSAFSAAPRDHFFLGAGDKRWSVA